MWRGCTWPFIRRILFDTNLLLLLFFLLDLTTKRCASVDIGQGSGCTREKSRWNGALGGGHFAKICSARMQILRAKGPRWWHAAGDRGDKFWLSEHDCRRSRPIDYAETIYNTVKARCVYRSVCTPVRFSVRISLFLVGMVREICTNFSGSTSLVLGIFECLFLMLETFNAKSCTRREEYVGFFDCGRLKLKTKTNKSIQIVSS